MLRWIYTEMQKALSIWQWSITFHQTQLICFLTDKNHFHYYQFSTTCRIIKKFKNSEKGYDHKNALDRTCSNFSFICLKSFTIFPNNTITVVLSRLAYPDIVDWGGNTEFQIAIPTLSVNKVYPRAVQKKYNANHKCSHIWHF